MFAHFDRKLYSPESQITLIFVIQETILPCIPSHLTEEYKALARLSYNTEFNTIKARNV